MSNLTEFELIARLCRDLPSNPSLVVGPGDDCAVLDVGMPGELLLLKTDAVVEGVHFTPDADPRKIGHKAMARPLSDIAAMGGTATAALVTLALPRDFDAVRLDEVYGGMNSLARRHHVAIAGGETTTSLKGMLLSISIIGKVAKEKVALRSRARPGDALFVTGELGGSLAGKHLEFEPRLDEGRWLAENFNLGAMIDLSDGLAGDLRHILNASKAGAELLLTALPVSRAARIAAKAGSGAKSPIAAALGDGEDFELLFTVPGSQAVPLLDAWKQRFPKLRLTCVGKITKSPGIVLRDKTGARPLKEHGYVHFA
jgi:thiamine-monophosphate kinase